MPFDGPPTPENSHEYEINVLVPLQKGEGVACFVVRHDGHQLVLYCSHKLSGQAEEIAADERDFVRAAQAVAIQREARDRAATAGFKAVIQ